MRDARARRLMVLVLMAAGVAMSGCQSPAGTPGTPTITSGGPIPSAVGTADGASSRSTDVTSPGGPVTTGPTTAAEVRANVPEAAKEHTPDGAGAFVRYYIEMINSASFRRQEGLMSGLADKKCRSCLIADEDVDDLLKKDQRYQAPPLKIIDVYPHATDAPGRQLVNAIVQDVRNEVVDARGKVVEKIKGGQYDYLFDLRWKNDEWVAYEFQVDQVDGRR